MHKHRLERCAGKSFATIYVDDEISEAWERFEKIEDFEWTFHCEQCIAVGKVEQSRRKGEDDHFPVYEKTLNSHNVEIIEALRIQIMENFRSTINVPKYISSYAVEAEPGAYTYPLTIRINWVTTDDEQNQIVSFIEAFLQRQELNQAKIIFLAKEVLLNC